MDREDDHVDYSSLDWVTPGDDGVMDLPPPDLGYGPGRGPRRRHFPVESPGHGLTAVMCGLVIAMGGLTMIILTASRTGGTIDMAYVLSGAVAALFLGTFYIGGVWLGVQRGTLIPPSALVAPDARAMQGQPPQQTPPSPGMSRTR